MGIEVVTYFSTLLKLAREEYEAEKSGDILRHESAKLAHEEYRQLCLSCDRMIVSTNN